MSFHAVTAYERYLARAKSVVEGAPYWKSIDNEDFARLSVEGDQATLWWLDISSGYYGDYETDKESVTFPAHLLTMPEDTFNAWKAEQRAEYSRKLAAESKAADERRAAAAKAQAEVILANGVLLDGKRYKLVADE